MKSKTKTMKITWKRILLGFIFFIIFGSINSGAMAAVSIGHDMDEVQLDFTLESAGANSGGVGLLSSWTQQAKINAVDTEMFDRFGASVDIDSNTVVVGAFQEDADLGSGALPDAGSAYIFILSGNTWVQQVKLNASDAGSNDYFGWSVAISGDTVVIGAWQDDPDLGAGELGNAGSVYVFVRTGSSWSQQAKLNATDAESEDMFGYSIAIDGDTIVVGAKGEDPDLGDGELEYAGSAYVFTRSNGIWSQQAKLNATDAEASDVFGFSVAIDGNTIVVAAPWEYPDLGAGLILNGGSVYVFFRSAGNWIQQEKLNALDTWDNAQFGFSVGIDGDTIISGARFDAPDLGSGPIWGAGSAYIFKRSGSNWIQQAKLNANDAQEYDRFGWSVAIDGDLAIAGAIYQDLGGAAIDGGAAYVFVRVGSSWSQQSKLYDPAAQDNNDWFGRAVSIDEINIVIGASDEDPDLGAGEINTGGSAYVYELELIVDDLDAEFSKTGSWTTFSGSKSQYNYHGDSMQYKSSGDGSGTATFRPFLPFRGEYEVFAWLAERSDGATNIPFTINYNGGTTVIRKDIDGFNGGTASWVSLGTFDFANGCTGTVVVSDDADGTVVADAIKWELVSSGSPLSTPTFCDVSFDNPLYRYIQALWDAGFTAGCSTEPLMFCGDTILDRAQAAVFMLRGQFGSGYVPPVEPWETFDDDWSPGTWAEKWAEGMWAEGLTAGCQASGDPLIYCPWDQLPREQAAVFGLRMMHGMSYTPPPATGTLFTDMTDVNYWATKWAEQAYLDGLLPACSEEPLTFCPYVMLDRAGGAFLIVQAKDLPLP